jgi:hypothetical protein
MEALVVLYLEVLCLSPELSDTCGLPAIAGIRGLPYIGWSKEPCFREVPRQ